MAKDTPKDTKLEKAATPDNEHNFRYLLKPGNDFRLARQFKAWVIISTLLCFASIGLLFLNKSVRGDYLYWTIDFKGGTEIVYSFADKDNPTKTVKVDPGTIRAAIAAAGDKDAEVADMGWDTDAGHVDGEMVASRRFGAMTEQQQAQASQAIQDKFGEKGISKISWSGDRVFIRSGELIPADDMANVLKTAVGVDMKPVETQQQQLNTTANEDTHEYNAAFTVFGLDRQYAQAIEQAVPNVQVTIVQAFGVGAKAGDKLRNDGIKALFYAMGLIMLYLAIRFDIRYAPGAVVAMIHDALMVVGAFALTWTEVSLTSVAALLTVIGFSVNDTVIIFDRMRENMGKLKDKKIERVVEISLNEVLVRSLLTSFTLFCTTLMMNVFGTGLVKNFAFAMNVGVIVGSYSSIFLAPPLFLWIHRRWYTGPPPARARRAQQVAAEV